MRVVADSHALIWYLFDNENGRLTPDQLAATVDLLNHPDSSLDPIPITTDVVAAFGSIPLPAIRDPWDRLIMATAIDLGLPLVSADAQIAATGLVEILW